MLMKRRLAGAYVMSEILWLCVNGLSKTAVRIAKGVNWADNLCKNINYLFWTGIGKFALRVVRFALVLAQVKVRLDDWRILRQSEYEAALVDSV